MIQKSSPCAPVNSGIARFHPIVYFIRARLLVPTETTRVRKSRVYLYYCFSFFSRLASSVHLFVWHGREMGRRARLAHYHLLSNVPCKGAIQVLMTLFLKPLATGYIKYIQSNQTGRCSIIYFLVTTSTYVVFEISLPYF